MGVKLSGLLYPEVLSLNHLAGKKVVVDGCNLLFKYISKIRKNDQILYSNQGDPVSHIIGFFYFCINLVERRIRPIFVFDGYTPAEKREKSPEKIARLLKMWQFYNKSTSHRAAAYGDPLFLYDKIISDLQSFIRYMGFPVIRGITEGEAQGAALVKAGTAYGMITEDYDSLLFGCPRTIRGINFRENICYYINLDQHRNHWNLTQEKLIDMALLIGTDYNAGMKGIGPKKALSLIQKYGYIEHIPNLDFPIDLNRIRQLFLKPTNSKVEPMFRAPNTKYLPYFLQKKGFSTRRIDRGITRLQLAFHQITRKQTTIDAFT